MGAPSLFLLKIFPPPYLANFNRLNYFDDNSYNGYNCCFASILMRFKIKARLSCDVLVTCLTARFVLLFAVCFAFISWELWK